MLALRLVRGSHPLVLLRRLLVACVAAGVGFLLLSALGYAMAYPENADAALGRLLWCLLPLAAAVQLAVAVARTDPAMCPRSGLYATGIGPSRVAFLAAASTAVSCLLGSAIALLVFLHLRGAGPHLLPFDGAAGHRLAAGRPLPVGAALTLLVLLPAVAAVASAVSVRSRWRRSGAGSPRGARRGAGGPGAVSALSAVGALGAVGAYGVPGAPAAPAVPGAVRAGAASGVSVVSDAAAAPGVAGASGASGAPGAPGTPGGQRDGSPVPSEGVGGQDDGPGGAAVQRGSGLRGRPWRPGAPAHPGGTGWPGAGLPGGAAWPGGPFAPAGAAFPGRPGAPTAAEGPQPTPAGLPWGAALVAAGLAVEAYASRTGSAVPDTSVASLLVPLPGAMGGIPLGVVGGWLLTALGLMLAGPGLTHLSGQLLAGRRAGALRLLSGRLLQTEARRIGRPLGVLCAASSGVLAAAILADSLAAGGSPLYGPLTLLGAVLVLCCSSASVLTAAMEVRTARAGISSALLRLGAPKSLLRGAVALRATVLLAVFAPPAWAVAQLVVFPVLP